VREGLIAPKPCRKVTTAPVAIEEASRKTQPAAHVTVYPSAFGANKPAPAFRRRSFSKLIWSVDLSLRFSVPAQEPCERAALYCRSISSEPNARYGSFISQDLASYPVTVNADVARWRSCSWTRPFLMTVRSIAKGPAYPRRPCTRQGWLSERRKCMPGGAFARALRCELHHKTRT
jgi:hypothetical protein